MVKNVHFYWHSYNSNHFFFSSVNSLPYITLGICDHFKWHFNCGDKQNVKEAPPLDSKLSFESQVAKVIQPCFAQLRQLSRIQSFLSPIDPEKIIPAFISSRLDYILASASIMYRGSNWFKMLLPGFQQGPKDMSTSYQSFQPFTGYLWVLEQISRSYCLFSKL